jgi:hypothetical protein
MARHPLPRVESGLDAATDALDSLKAEVRLGFRDQRHFDEMEEQAEAGCKKVRGSFRDARSRAVRLRGAREQ